MTLHAIEPPPSPSLAKSLVRITTDQYHLMIERGIIPEDSSTELLNGLIVTKDRGDYGGEAVGHSPLHALVVSLLGGLAGRINSSDRHLRIQLPISIVPQNEPEPDGSVIRGQPREYQGRMPAAADVYCIIEVAHSSLERDSDDKLPLYASAGIPQYVIVNLRENQVEVYSEPDAAAGRYAAKATAAKGEKVRLNMGKGEWLEIQAAEILP